jgi:hypothetical protein
MGVWAVAVRGLFFFSVNGEISEGAGCGVRGAAGVWGGVGWGCAGHEPKRFGTVACSEAACGQRFCEHCLAKHMAHAEGPGPRPAAGWRCPICRGDCCCLLDTCTRPHRHCKRYRRAKWRRQDLETAAAGGEQGGGAAGGVAVATVDGRWCGGLGAAVALVAAWDAASESVRPLAAVGDALAPAFPSTTSITVPGAVGPAAVLGPRAAVDRADVGLLLDFCQAHGGGEP